MNKTYEIIIVGAGPAGIALASAAVERGIKSNKILLLEKATNHSWSIRKFYPDKKLVTANYKGQDGGCEGDLCLIDSSKDETLSYLTSFIDKHHLEVRYNSEVSEIILNKNGLFSIKLGEGRSVLAKTCAIAIGVLGRPNKPTYKIGREVRPYVSFDVTSKDLTNSKILVIGGGDSASEYVQYLNEKGNDLTLSYRREEFSKMNELNLKKLSELAATREVQIYLNSDIQSLSSSTNFLVEVSFKNGKKENFDHLIYALGGSTPVNFLKSLGIEMDDSGPVLNEHYESSVPGLFVVGDVSSGKKGGSINLAFNSSHNAIGQFCRHYLDCLD